MVAVEIDSKRSTADLLRGRVVEILGNIDAPTTDSKRVILRHDLPREFPPSVLLHSNEVSTKLTEKEISGRRDLRSLPFVTIDGADARDHDDAIVMEDSTTCWVAIADVGHYIAPDSPLDHEAASRANSYYFPDLVLPMLPERLSNNICSLRPKEDRLVLAAKLQFTLDGTLERTTLVGGIICSQARLTYEGVDEAFARGRASNVPPEILPMLRNLKTLAEKIFDSRMKEGGIDFDFSETKVILNEHGDVEAMARRVRTPSQRIVEELMLAANRGVAEVLGKAGYPLVYRIHYLPQPKKLKEYLNVLRAYGFKVRMEPEQADPKELGKVLLQIGSTPRGKVLTALALRAMAQAAYSPQNVGHYGLGFQEYVHFTSPIRRYADLVVHRQVRRYLRKENPKSGILFPPRFGSMENLSLHISALERTAQLAEREIQQLKGIRFLMKKRGRLFWGIVVGMIEHGFFVELEDHSVEGMVHVRRLPQDRYEFDPATMTFNGRKRGRVFRLGDRLRLRLEEASLEEARIDFSLAGS